MMAPHLEWNTIREKIFSAAVILIATLLCNNSFGQNSSSSSIPHSWQLKLKEIPDSTFLKFHTPSLSDISDQINSHDFRFAIGIESDINFLNSATSYATTSGTIYRLGIASKDAKSLNFVFNKFDLPDGAILHVYNKKKTHKIGPYTNNSCPENIQFSTFPIAGESLIIELFQPFSSETNTDLQISQVNYGFRSVSEIQERLGDCHVSTYCAVADPHRNQVESVVMILFGSGQYLGTGVMVANTSGNFKPYLLTGSHLLENSNQLSNGILNWSIYFGFEADSCNPNFYTHKFTNYGAIVRANYSPTDHLLVELFNAPPPFINTYYAGWDRSGNISSSVFSIHNAGLFFGKAIVFNTGFVTSDNISFNGKQYKAWHIDEWINGTTVPGSSGAPLFDQNGRVIGNLIGGKSNCDHPYDDYFGRFGVAWEGGGSSSNSLKYWLDPLDTRVEKIDGAEYNWFSGITPPEQLGVIIGPNPSSDYMKVEITNHLKSKGSLIVTDLKGSEVSKFSIDGPVTILNLANIESGVYKYSLLIENKLTSGKFVVSK